MSAVLKEFVPRAKIRKMNQSFLLSPHNSIQLPFKRYHNHGADWKHTQNAGLNI